MEDQELIKKLSTTGKDRVTLYLSPSKVEHTYVQTVAQVTELIRKRKVGGKISGSILGFLGLEVNEEGGLEAKVSMTPFLQAMITEKAAEQAKRLVDLTTEYAVQGPLMRYTGPALFTTMASHLNPNPATIPLLAWEIISRRRQTQEEIMKWKNKDAGTVVLTFTKDKVVYASIASTESLDVNLFGSYFQQPIVGILCRMEGAPEDDVTFLDPIWIWHEAP
jgi:hypothetical protein